MISERSGYWFAVTAGALAIVLGVGVLVGWAFDIAFLKSVLPGHGTLKANAAVAFVLAGVSLQLLGRPYVSWRRMWISRACALLAGIVAAMSFTESLLGVDLGIDELLFKDPGVSLPGRLAPNTALSFVLLAAAMLLLDNTRRVLRTLSQVLAGLVLLASFFAISGYLLSIDRLYAVPSHGPMSLHAAMGLAVLSAGVLGARPQRGAVAILLQDTSAGKVVRRLLPLTVLALLAMGWLQLQGQRAGLYDMKSGFALMIVSCVALFVLLVLWSVGVHGRGERDRQEAAGLIDAVKDHAIYMLDTVGNIVTWNAGAARLNGYRAEDIIGKSFSCFYAAEDLVQGKPEHDLKATVENERHEVEAWRIRKDGSRFLANIVITAMRDEQRRLIGFANVTRDVTERVLAAEQLRVALESLPSGMIMIDNQGRIVLVNVHVEQLFGYSRAELIGASIETLVPERYRAQHREFREMFLGQRQARAMGAGRDVYGLRKDGTEVAIEIGLNPLQTYQGDFVLSSVVDISERKRAEAHLRILNARLEERVAEQSGNLESVQHDLHTIIDALPSMISYWDKNLIARLVNRACSRWFKGDPAQMPGTHLRQLLGDELFESTVQHANAALNGNAVTFERRLPSLDGATLDDVIVHFVPDVIGGEVQGFYALLHDITTAKDAQRRLMESEAFLEHVERVSGVGGFMVDLSSGIPRWTRQSCRIYDLSDGTSPTREQAEGFLLPESRERMREALRNPGESGGRFDMELAATTATSRLIWLRTAGEVETQAGVPVRVVGAFEDITERRALQQKLRHATAAAQKANAAKSEFLANMSHEIRTPLNAIIGLGYLLEQTTLGQDQRQLLAKIQFAGRSLLAVINDVLDLAKVESGEVSIEDEPFDLPELVRDLSQMLAPQALAKGIELIASPSSELPRVVKGDEARLRQILTNLLGNAIKFTEVGRVDLKVFGTEQSSARIRLRCEVTDTGIGIEPAAIERLFTPFTQADASTTRRFGGTGLGLSIVRSYVELMGGDLGVTSTPAVGSTFWIEITLQVVRDVDTAAHERSRRTLHILIADSHNDEASRLGAMVRALGWSPSVVAAGEQLLQSLSESSTRPDVLILPLHFIDDSADRFVAVLQRAEKSIELPSVIIIADVAHSAEQTSIGLSGGTLLVRPVSGSGLFNAVNSALSKRRDGHERLLEATNFDEISARWLPGVRVLVVDDNDINLLVAQRILERQGAVVASCVDGAAALEYVRSHHEHLDIVLMDVQMPVLDGNEATRRIRAEPALKNLPIVALTAGALVGERQRALEAGMNDFISKPFDPKVLIRKLRRLVEEVRGEPLAVEAAEQSQPRTGGVASGPFMSCIDSGIVQQLFGEDLVLFKSVLGRVVKEYAEFARPLTDSLDDPIARKRVQALAHKLKGSAGMIGATDVRRLAGAAEAALKNERAAEVVSEILEQLASALVRLREEAAPLLQSERATAPSIGIPAGSSIDVTDIDELCALLESQNLAALDKFGVLANSLSEVLSPARFESVRDAIENLDFQLGTELLRASPLRSNSGREP